MSFIVDTESFDPYFNLAAEEYIFRRFSDEFVLLYINSDSVIIGKHQNAYEEINLKHILDLKIPVLRRISGGGSVFHDMGNLNFTFIGNRREGRQVNFAEQTRPVMNFLKEQGLEPWLGDKNEIRLSDWKFSGNAEHFFKNRVLHHGTLLFSSQLSQLGEALKQGSGVYKSRAVKSNRTNVGNLAPQLAGINDVFAFRDSLSEFMIKSRQDLSIYKLNHEDKAEINKLIEERYKSDEWNYSYGPDYSFCKTFLFEGSSIKLDLEVKKGSIIDIQISGNTRLESAAIALKNKKHLFTNVTETLSLELSEESDELALNFFR